MKTSFSTTRLCNTVSRKIASKASGSRGLLVCLGALLLMGLSCERKGSVTPDEDCLPDLPDIPLTNDRGRILASYRGGDTTNITSWYFRSDDSSVPNLKFCQSTPEVLKVKSLQVTVSGTYRFGQGPGRPGFGSLSLKDYKIIR